MRLALLLLSGSFLVLATGCALAGRRGPSAAQVAAARELSTQGAAAIDAGQWDHGERMLRQAIEVTPGDAHSRRYLAESLWRRGAFEDALAHIDAALEADPSNAAVAIRAGEMRLATHSFESAAARATQAIRIDPKLPAAWALRGRAYWQLKQVERALADFQRALELAPIDRGVLADTAALYRQIGQPTRCLTTIHQWIDTYPQQQAPQQALLLEGLTLKELGRSRQAAESLTAASRAGPPNAEILCQLAEVYLSLGEIESATAAANDALAVDANHAASRAVLAQLAVRSTSGEPLRR
jgi:tetratricopeptide (TPR) repeat protein